MHLWQASGSRGRGRCVFNGSCEVGHECARDFGGTGATAADFEFLVRGTGAGTIAAGLFGLGGRHGGGVLGLFDGFVGHAGVRREESVGSSKS